MSKKCFATLTLYVLFLVLMVGTALIYSYLNFNHVIGKVVIIVILMLVSSALALTVERGSVITIALNAVLWGTALSFLFDHLGCPDPLHMVYVTLVMIAWFMLFCFLTNLCFTRKNHAISMIFWGIILAIADTVFALFMKDALGWTSIILLAPFITFFTALPGAADGFTEHTHHIAIYSTIPALLIAILVLFFRTSIRSFDRVDFFPEVDEDYIFIYRPKDSDDEGEHATEDLSDLM